LASPVGGSPVAMATVPVTIATVAVTMETVAITLAMVPVTIATVPLHLETLLIGSRYPSNSSASLGNAFDCSMVP
jgi:hypothetical protein